MRLRKGFAMAYYILLFVIPVALIMLLVFVLRFGVAKKAFYIISALNFPHFLITLANNWSYRWSYYFYGRWVKLDVGFDMFWTFYVLFLTVPVQIILFVLFIIIIARDAAADKIIKTGNYIKKYVIISAVFVFNLITAYSGYEMLSSFMSV